MKILSRFFSEGKKILISYNYYPFFPGIRVNPVIVKEASKALEEIRKLQAIDTDKSLNEALDKLETFSSTYPFAYDEIRVHRGKIWATLLDKRKISGEDKQSSQEVKEENNNISL